MKQLVSILIPAFNAEKWLSGCIESALAQTWPTKEIIIIDDGSRDATLDIALKYASASAKVVTQKNSGASAARNHALSLAKGDYIQWLDADDLLAPDKIEWQMKFAESGQVSKKLLSGAWGRFYHVPERTRYSPDALWEDLNPVEWLYRKIDGNLWMAIESWLVSRRLTDMAGQWNENLSLDDDGEYFCRVLQSSEEIKYVPEAKCFCRRSTFGISHALTLSDRKLDSQFTSLVAHIRVMRAMEDSPRTRAACLKLLNRWVIYFYPERPDLISRMNCAARELGSVLDTPKLREKYQWLQRLFGWRMAKRAQYVIPALRSQIDNCMELLRSSSSYRT